MFLPRPNGTVEHWLSVQFYTHARILAAMNAVVSSAVHALRTAAQVGRRKALARSARAPDLAGPRSPPAGRTVLRRLAMVLGLQPRRALLNDVNPHLIGSTASWRAAS